MSVSLCIHGHFYQPPREDPWLGSILAEPSAAPMRHWNERILRESYAPLAWARRQDQDGRILDLVNCYEWTSFNAGPTLLRWMRHAFPRVVKRMVKADAKSIERWGHGNAMAQIYHHVIMPLATEEDRALETRWAIDDFRYYFGRDPEGMWLSECAVDLPSLETLVEHGIRFVILAPRQAKAVILDGENVPVNEGNLNVGEPYKVSLPSGRSITAVFYHGRLSQSIAFEGLLRNGEGFWQRIREEAHSLVMSGQDAPLMTIATDGETYGHHFTFGEMALAYVLSQGAYGRDNIRLTNIAAYTASNPPIREVLLHEPSSWSCVHGVERWRSDCGCTDGGHMGWNQQWRGPLRAALDRVREAVVTHYYEAGKSCFTDSLGALMAYGEVLADPERSEGFAKKWFKGDEKDHDTAWKLLSMREQCLASFASCAWFFDDIGRIEPENGMTFALRALDLLKETGGQDIIGTFADGLAAAHSNQPEYGNGREVFEKDVLPRKDDAATLCLLAWLLLVSECKEPQIGVPVKYEWPEVSVELIASLPLEGMYQEGVAIIRTSHETLGTRYEWRINALSQTRMDGVEFVPMSETVIHVRPENAGQEKEICRSVKEFSRPMNDALSSLCLENWEKGVRPELQSIAAHAASMTYPWLESQHDVVRPDFWIGFIPYLVVETMISDFITSKQRRQIEVILSLHLAPRAKTLAHNLVEEYLLNVLEGKSEPRSDEVLASWVRRVKYVMPDMDWWSVQNMVWELGVARYPLMSKELGFRLTD